MLRHMDNSLSTPRLLYRGQFTMTHLVMSLSLFHYPASAGGLYERQLLLCRHWFQGGLRLPQAG